MNDIHKVQQAGDTGFYPFFDNPRFNLSSEPPEHLDPNACDSFTIVEDMPHHGGRHSDHMVIGSFDDDRPSLYITTFQTRFDDDVRTPDVKWAVQTMRAFRALDPVRDRLQHVVVPDMWADSNGALVKSEVPSEERGDIPQEWREQVSVDAMAEFIAINYLLGNRDIKNNLPVTENGEFGLFDIEYTGRETGPFRKFALNAHRDLWDAGFYTGDSRYRPPQSFYKACERELDRLEPPIDTSDVFAFDWDF